MADEEIESNDFTDSCISSSDIKAILYTSNTGYTKQYAKMLSEKLKIPAYNIAEDYTEVPQGAEIIYMGWIMAGGVKGYEKIAKNYQVRALCGVGLSVDTGKQVDELAERHHVSESTEVFYLQGGFDMGKLTGVNKLLMKVMRDVVRRSIAKKDDVTEDEQIAFELMCKGGSFVDEQNLVQIETWFQAQS